MKLNHEMWVALAVVAFFFQPGAVTVVALGLGGGTLLLAKILDLLIWLGEKTSK